MTVGALIAFNMFAGQVTAPVLRFVQLWQDIQQVSVSIKRLGDILNMPTEQQPASGIALAQMQGAVRFAGISFAYHPGGAQVLNSVTLSVRPGEVIGIVGRSGSGKSTLWTTNLNGLFTTIWRKSVGGGRYLLSPTACPPCGWPTVLS